MSEIVLDLTNLESPSSLNAYVSAYYKDGDGNLTLINNCAYLAGVSACWGWLPLNELTKYVTEEGIFPGDEFGHIEAMDLDALTGNLSFFFTDSTTNYRWFEPFLCNTNTEGRLTLFSGRNRHGWSPPIFYYPEQTYVIALSTNVYNMAFAVFRPYLEYIPGESSGVWYDYDWNMLSQPSVSGSMISLSTNPIIVTPASAYVSRGLSLAYNVVSTNGGIMYRHNLDPRPNPDGSYKFQLNFNYWPRDNLLGDYNSKIIGFIGDYLHNSDTLYEPAAYFTPGTIRFTTGNYYLPETSPSTKYFYLTTAFVSANSYNNYVLIGSSPFAINGYITANNVFSPHQTFYIDQIYHNNESNSCAIEAKVQRDSLIYTLTGNNFGNLSYRWGYSPIDGNSDDKITMYDVSNNPVEFDTYNFGYYWSDIQYVVNSELNTLKILSDNYDQTYIFCLSTSISSYNSNEKTYFVYYPYKEINLDTTKGIIKISDPVWTSTTTVEVTCSILGNTPDVYGDDVIHNLYNNYNDDKIRFILKPNTYNVPGCSMKFYKILNGERVKEEFYSQSISIPLPKCNPFIIQFTVDKYKTPQIIPNLRKFSLDVSLYYREFPINYNFTNIHKDFSFYNINESDTNITPQFRYHYEDTANGITNVWRSLKDTPDTYDHFKDDVENNIIITNKPNNIDGGYYDIYLNDNLYSTVTWDVTATSVLIESYNPCICSIQIKSRDITMKNRPGLTFNNVSPKINLNIITSWPEYTFKILPSHVFTSIPVGEYTFSEVLSSPLQSMTVGGLSVRSITNIDENLIYIGTAYGEPGCQCINRTGGLYSFNVKLNQDYNIYEIYNFASHRSTLMGLVSTNKDNFFAVSTYTRPFFGGVNYIITSIDENTTHGTGGCLAINNPNNVWNAAKLMKFSWEWQPGIHSGGLAAPGINYIGYETSYFIASCFSSIITASNFSCFTNRNGQYIPKLTTEEKYNAIFAASINGNIYTADLSANFVWLTNSHLSSGYTETSDLGWLIIPGPGAYINSLCYDYDANTLFASVSDSGTMYSLSGITFHNNYTQSVDATWTTCSGVSAFGESTITNIEYCGNGILLAGTIPNGKLLRSTDHGSTWTSISATSATLTSIDKIKYIPSKNIVLAGVNGGSSPRIIGSANKGVTWHDFGIQSSVTYIKAFNENNSILLIGTGNYVKILCDNTYNVKSMINGHSNGFSIATETNTQGVCSYGFDHTEAFNVIVKQELPTWDKTFKDASYYSDISGNVFSLLSYQGYMYAGTSYGDYTTAHSSDGSLYKGYEENGEYYWTDIGSNVEMSSIYDLHKITFSPNITCTNSAIIAAGCRDSNFVIMYKVNNSDWKQAELQTTTQFANSITAISAAISMDDCFSYDKIRLYIGCTPTSEIFSLSSSTNILYCDIDPFTFNDAYVTSANWTLSSACFYSSDYNALSARTAKATTIKCVTNSGKVFAGNSKYGLITKSNIAGGIPENTNCAMYVPWETSLIFPDDESARVVALIYIKEEELLFAAIDGITSSLPAARIYCSTDYGITWNQIYAIGNIYNKINCFKLIKSTNTLFLQLEDTVGGYNKILISNDKGASWYNLGQQDSIALSIGEGNNGDFLIGR